MSLSSEPRSLFARLRILPAGLARCYSEIFFLADTTVGLILVAATLLNWNVGASGLLAVAAAWSFSKLVHMDTRFVQSGFYTYNPLLVGLSIGSNLSLSWLTAFLIISASILTFLLTVSLVHILRYYLNLPALSLPFVIASAITHLASLRYSNLVVNAPQVSPWLAEDLGLPIAVASFFKSLSAILFVPSVLVGITFSLLLVWKSRILFMLAVGGFVVGTFLRSAMFGSSEQAFRDLNSFNFILIAMAVGGVFLVPSWRSYLIAAAAVAVSTIFLDAVQTFGVHYGIPAYTLPFNVVSLVVIYTLGLNQFPGMAKFLGATPEETLETDLVRRARFHGQGRTLSLPFFGKWTVWQAFNDEWTHKGHWQYAYDFVITDEDGQTFSGAGVQWKDYYCFRKPVLAPCRGRVVKVVNDLPDNAIGRVDKTNNWGNHVVLYDERGFYVELSHFAEGSIKVRPGEWVEPGHVLGLCGNSGYSPQPHLHVHVQATEQVGSATLPFSFIGYLEADEFHANNLPAKGKRVEMAAIDAKLDALTDFLLNETLVFETFHAGKKTGTLTLNIKMAIDGTLYFESDRGGRLYFGKQAGTFYVYRLEGNDPRLGMIYLALPRLPLVRRERLEWQDFAPIGLVVSGPRRLLSHFVAPFVSYIARAVTAHRFVDRNTIESEITAPFWGVKRSARVELDPDHGFKSIQIGGVELRAVRDREVRGHSPNVEELVDLPKGISAIIAKAQAVASVGKESE